MSKLTTIDFHGAKLIAVPGDKPETTLVAMKPIVEGMGLDWTYQFRKISGHPVLSTCVAVIAIQMPGDDQVREHTFLSLEMMNFWLATIHPDRIKDQAVRANVIEYQTECARVLFNHFFGKALAAGSHLTAREVGGIVKAVFGKARGEMISEIMSGIKSEMMPIIQNLRVTHQTGTSAVTDRTAKEWLVQYGCAQTGRGRIVKRVGNALRALGMKQGIPLLRCARTNTWLFPHDLAVPFMESQGKAWVRLHNDEVLLGQKPIKEFTRRTKEAPRPFAKKPEPAS